MTVANVHAGCYHQVGVVLGLGATGALLGTPSGSLAALTLAIPQKTGLIFGAAAGGVSLPLFFARFCTPTPFRTCMAAAASVALGALAGYSALDLADAPPSSREIMKLAFLTYSLGATTLCSLRCIASRCRAPVRANETYMHLAEPTE